jgi:hypothetical protein
LTKHRFKKAALAAALGALFSAGILTASRAEASPYDPYLPMPPVWCPGGGGGSSWGGYCEGISYPDGTRWNINSFWAPFVGVTWSPMKCVQFTGQPNPPLAPNGCGMGGPVVAR